MRRPKISRKETIYLILFLLVIVFFFIYKREHRLYKKTLQLNTALATELNKLTEENERLTAGLEEIQRRKSLQKEFNPTFVDQARYFRQNWEEYIRLSENDYQTGLLGGIKDLQISVSNKTDFNLNEVVVLLNYFKANRKLFKTERVTLQHIAAGDLKTVKAPSSKRGMSVEASFYKITSREMNFCWSQKASQSGVDPYKCK